MMLKTTIEERVALLEIQVVEIEDDVTGLDQDVNFLFDEQVIQDARIFTLEQTSIEIDEQVEGICLVMMNHMKSPVCKRNFHVYLKIYP